jgi:four helix bundle protein
VTKPSKRIQFHWQLEVYTLSVEGAMAIFEVSKTFPREETYSLTDQIRRSSRAVSALFAEAWRRRKYKAAFINKLNESEGEAGETQVWLEYAVKCGYVDRSEAKQLHRTYDYIIGKLVRMANEPDPWLLKPTQDL